MKGSRFLIILLVLIFIHEEIAAKLPQKAWETVASHLIPEEHPLKKKLDRFFSRERVTFNKETLKNAGFSNWTPREATRLIVAKHPEFPGYIFKLFLDVQRYHHSRPEWELFSLRVIGANLIREEIAKQGWEDLFKVPKKWIYALPQYPKPPKGYLPKYFVIVEEDMELLSDDQNRTKWKSDEVTFEQLSCLYHILAKYKLVDCTKIDNVPFSIDGRIAFIDTQSFNRGRVSWKKFKGFLSSENKTSWTSLTQKVN